MTPKCKSFLHLHLGFNAEGLENIPLHSIWVDDWSKGITAERNVVVLSIPSALDPTMSPPNKHILHGYTPANEPWEKWENLKIGTKEYEKTKEERCSVFWQPIKKLIPDIQERIEIKMLGTPLTHQRFLNTKNGSYGPALSAAEGLFPGNKTPIKNLLLCGSSTFPGIGIPPVAASGAMAANTILGSKFQRHLIEELGI
jgi:phytoene dehydrogenase-like protein